MKHSFKDWFFATRPWGYPASVIPALIVISYVFYLNHTGTLINVNWWYGVLAALGAAIFQASGNLISDYFDFKNNVDKKESFGSSRMIVDGIFSAKEMLYFGLTLLFIGSLIGIFFLFNVPITLLWIGIAGVLGTYFYYVLKFRALGDLNIFIIYGQLISLGTFLVMTNATDWKVLLIGASTGFLIVNILHANNMRDIKHDGEAKIKTQAMVLGVKNSIRQYVILGYGAYLMIFVCVILGILHWLTLVIFLSIPLLIKNIKIIKTADIERPENIKDMDAQTAQHLTAFGVLLIIANFVAGFIA